MRDGQKTSAEFMVVAFFIMIGMIVLMFVGLSMAD